MHLVNQFLEGNDFYEPAQASSVFIYLMVRAPNEFKNMQLPTQSTPLQMLFQFIAKVFETGQESGIEFTSMCGVSLIIAIMEHLGQKDPLIIG